MKNIKKALFSLILISPFLTAMNDPLEGVKKQVKEAQAEPNLHFVVEEFKPNRDKNEVFELYKNAWATNLGGEYSQERTVGGQGNSRKISTEQYIADHLVNPVAMGPDFKYVDVARDAQASEGSKIQGIATYYMVFPKPENPTERQRGYIETLISKAELSDVQRTAVEKELLQKAMSMIKKYNPEFYEKYVRSINNVSIQVFKDAGFKEIKRGKDSTGSEWILFETSRPEQP